MKETVQLKLLREVSARAAQAQHGTPQIFFMTFVLQLQACGITDAPLDSVRDLLLLNDRAAEQALALLQGR